MIRALNSIHSQAHVPKTSKEKKSFAGFALCWCEFTHHHHEGVLSLSNTMLTYQEERFLFPACEKRVPGSMVENVEQHHMFMEGFHTMEEYFTHVQKDPSVYDGNKVTAIIEQFGGVFCTHLTEEIDTLEPSKMRAIFPVEEEFKKIHTEMMEWIIGTCNKLTTMPWVSSTLVLIDDRPFPITKRELRLGC
jgi:hypothetical protein